MTFWHFTSSHEGGQGRGDTGVYLGVFQLQKLAFQFCLACSQPMRNNVNLFNAYRVQLGPRYTKTKELIGSQEIARATIA